MSKFSFVTDELVRFPFDDESWVDVKKELPFEEFSSIFKNADGDNKAKNLDLMIPLLEKSIVAWSDTTHPVSPENIHKLSTATLLALAELIMPMYTPEKKS